MWQDIYVREKIRELSLESLPEGAPVRSAQAVDPALTRLARRTGRLLRLAGERLELWASPPAEAHWQIREQRRLER